MNEAQHTPTPWTVSAGVIYKKSPTDDEGYPIIALAHAKKKGSIMRLDTLLLRLAILVELTRNGEPIADSLLTLIDELRQQGVA